uniref:Up-regulated in Daf-2 domain-containing protein n=1 Tax=Alexandrium monilatum TaxID=311494 RepID=A0A7S4R9L6_9DINO
MCLSGAATPQVLLWLTCLLGASAKRTHADIKRHVLDSNSTGLPVNVGIQVENDTPYDIDQLLLIHKFNGVDPPVHVLQWDDVKSKALTPPKEVTTTTGFGLRNDWWIMSWKFKAKKGQRCPCCKKKNGACEMWVTDPKNALGQFFLDPVSYVKIVGGIINSLVVAMSCGAAATAGTALMVSIADLLTDTLTADESTEGLMDFGIGEEDVTNWQEKRRPIRVRIKAAWQVGDRVTWTGSDKDIPEGVVGEVTKVDDDHWGTLYRIEGTFPVQNQSKHESWMFLERQLRHAFRAGDIVTTVDDASQVGKVVEYSSNGYVGVQFLTGLRWLPSQQLELHTVRFLDSEDNPPSFKVEILEFQPPELTTEEQVGRRGVNKWTAPRAIRRQETIHASAMPCADEYDTSLAQEVPITVVNRATRTIKRWGLLHKFNSLTPPVDILDSDAPLPPGGSSWARPVPNASLAGKKLVVNRDRTPVLWDAATWDVLAVLNEGKSVVAKGDSVTHSDGSTVVPLEPIGVIQLTSVNILGDADPMSVRTETGLTFHNDWWTIAWSFEGEGELGCEVRTAMEVGFFKGLTENPKQRLLNLALVAATDAMQVPVFWAGVLDVVQYFIEKDIRNDNLLQMPTRPAYYLFGLQLLNLLSKGTSTQGYRKCNLSKRDVKRGSMGKPVEIEIRDDRVVIKADGGDRECELEIADKGCLHTPECSEAQVCKDAAARQNFEKSEDIV